MMKVVVHCQRSLKKKGQELPRQQPQYNKKINLYRQVCTEWASFSYSAVWCNSATARGSKESQRKYRLINKTNTRMRDTQYSKKLASSLLMLESWRTKPQKRIWANLEMLKCSSACREDTKEALCSSSNGLSASLPKMSLWLVKSTPYQKKRGYTQQSVWLYSTPCSP